MNTRNINTTTAAAAIAITILLTGCNDETTTVVTAPTAITANDSILNSEDFIQRASMLDRKSKGDLGISTEDILEIINRYRTKPRTCGGDKLIPAAQPLTYNQKLGDASAIHNLDMILKKYFDHKGISGDSFIDRIRHIEPNAGITIGENIAAGQSDIEEVFAAWIQSPGHCVNIMNPGYQEFGLSVILDENSEYQIYWGTSFSSNK